MNMKIKKQLLLAVAVLLPLFPCFSQESDAPDPRMQSAPPVSAEASFFYDKLAPYGRWLWVAPHGWVWTPNNVSATWRPYTDGHWVYADCGWTWASDQAWGWAPFHYGRWFFNDHEGWCWVPGSEWAPAWVSWHWGDEWCGWAPMPPQVSWQTRADWDAIIPNFSWCFVPTHNFYDRHLDANLALVARNVTLLRLTRNITHLDVRDGHFFNLSLAPELVEKAVGRTVRHFEIAEVNSPAEALGPLKGKSAISFFRPLVTAAKVLFPLPGIGMAPSKAPEVTFDKLQRDQAAHRELVTQQTREKEALEKVHDAELRSPPRGVAAPELMQRHQAEHTAFNEHVARQNQVFEHQRQTAPPAPEKGGDRKSGQ